MADVDNKIKMIVEGCLLAAGKPLSLGVIASVFSEDERPDNAELKEVLEAISDDCNDRGFELNQVASGYRFQVKQDISEWIARLWEEKPPRYSRALLETLALIAYRQPITRGDVEEIRGVGVSSNIIRTLVDREWVRIVGHKDVPGKPALYATTRQFLDYFNLKSIQELPPLAEIRELAEAGDEFNVEDDLANRNVLELPEDGAEEPVQVFGEEGETLTFEPDELPDEDEAAELSRKPLDEILGLPADDEEQEVQDAEPDQTESVDQERLQAQRDQVEQVGQERQEGQQPKPGQGTEIDQEAREQVAHQDARQETPERQLGQTENGDLKDSGSDEPVQEQSDKESSTVQMVHASSEAPTAQESAESQRALEASKEQGAAEKQEQYPEQEARDTQNSEVGQNDAENEGRQRLKSVSESSSR